MLFAFSVIFFAAVKPLSLLLTSIPCDMSKVKSSYVFNCTYLSFQGDWGGPLVASNRVVGILSLGYTCNNLNIIDLYIKVSAVCDWIVTNAGL
jgi:secreted trypsin-like serine protease